MQRLATSCSLSFVIALAASPTLAAMSGCARGPTPADAARAAVTATVAAQAEVAVSATQPEAPDTGYAATEAPDTATEAPDAGYAATEAPDAGYAEAPETAADPDAPAPIIPRQAKTEPVWRDPKTEAFILLPLDGTTPTFEPDGGAVAVPLTDAAVVKLIATKPAERDTERVPVLWNGKRGTVPRGLVFGRKALTHLGPASAAPAGAPANTPNDSPTLAVDLASTIAECGDVCHTAAWALFADGTRVSLDDDAVDPTIALSPDGGRLAYGGRVLVLVDLATKQAHILPAFTAPSWAPDGSLWARDAWTYMGPDHVDCFTSDAPGTTPCDAKDPAGLAASGDRVWRIVREAAPELVVALPGQLRYSSPGDDQSAGAPVTFKDGVASATFARTWTAPRVAQACAVCEGRPAEALPCTCAATKVKPGQPGEIVVRLTLPTAPH